MNMSQNFSPDILSLSSEPAIFEKAGRISFANPAACRILGGSCVSRPTAELFGSEFSQIQAHSFITEASIFGRRYALRVNRMDKGRLIFLSDCEPSQLLLSEALLFSLRESLMSYSLSIDLIRSQAESLADEKLLSAISSISHSYYKMLRVLNNVSTVMGISTGTAVFVPIELDIAGFCAAIVEALRFLFPRVSFKLSNQGIHPIVADRDMVELILLNLLSNSLVHGHGCRHLSLNLLETKDSLIISVDDDGCGIAPERLGTIFDRYRHSYDMQSISQGAGLGLTAVRSAARLHGGTLLLESRRDKGTTARVSLSRHIPPQPLHSPDLPWECNSQLLLTGLSNALDDSHYNEKFMD